MSPRNLKLRQTLLNFLIDIFRTNDKNRRNIYTTPNFNRLLFQTRQPVFVQLLGAAFRVSQCSWLTVDQRVNVENCIRTLSEVAKARGIAIPSDLDIQVLYLQGDGSAFTYDSRPARDVRIERIFASKIPYNHDYCNHVVYSFYSRSRRCSTRPP